VQEAFLHARDIDQDLVDAQQTRRVLDRLSAIRSPPRLHGIKVRRGLLGWAVQTVVESRLIVDEARAGDSGVRAG